MIYSLKSKFLYINVWEWLDYNEVLDFIISNKVESLVIDHTAEYFLFSEDFVDDHSFFKKLDRLNLKECYVFSGKLLDDDILTKYGNIKFISYPFSFLSRTAAYGRTGFKHALLVKNSKDISNLFHSHVGRPRKHRCLLIDELSKENLFDYGNISYSRTIGDFIQSDSREDIDKHFKYQYWTEGITLDSDVKGSTDTVINGIDQYQKPGEQYISSLFDLVLETNHQSIFWTEKTWKPVLYGKPFIIWGAPHINRKLEDYGFQLYDKIIDYSFDEIPDLNERAQALVKELKRLSLLNYQDIYNSIKSTCEKNRFQAYKIIQGDLESKSVTSFINKMYPDFGNQFFSFLDLEINSDKLKVK